MTNKQLNNLVISYQQKWDERVFSKVYEEVTSRWKRENVFYSLARRYGIDITEVESLAHEVLYDISRRYEDHGDFYNFLSKVLSGKCIDLRRKYSREIDSEISLHSTVSEEDDDNPIIKFLAHANAEDEAIANLQRKSDQKQLIAQLLDKAPDKSRQALEAYIKSDFSYPQAAKLLGTKYDTVKRRVEKIATYFDANQNGDIYDYFTVATA